MELYRVTKEFGPHPLRPGRRTPPNAGATSAPLPRRVAAHEASDAASAANRPCPIDGSLTSRELPMEHRFAPQSHGLIQGQMLRLSEHHAVAIYLRDGHLWVADFIEGQGTLVDATTWFRFNCGSLANSHALRRMALESATPISLELSERIAALHSAVVAGSEQDLLGLVEGFIKSLRPARLVALVASRFRRRNAQQVPLARHV
jgi:hypothetical protein